MMRASQKIDILFGPKLWIALGQGNHLLYSNLYLNVRQTAQEIMCVWMCIALTIVNTIF